MMIGFECALSRSAVVTLAIWREIRQCLTAVVFGHLLEASRANTFESL